MHYKEKKMDKPISIRLMPSTKAALDKLIFKEDRSIGYIIERIIRQHLKLDNE